MQLGEYQVIVEKVKKKRTLDQNALQWLWCKEILEQKGDESINEIQRINKLEFGCPILQEDLDFFLFYQNQIAPIPYECQLKIMDYISVTSLMTTKQFSKYLDDVFAYWTKQNYTLTFPGDFGLDNY